jgi:ubiquinone/menaquinone biosynthesis C-methylase UbiE
LAFLFFSSQTIQSTLETMTETTGRILHRAAGYDLLVWFITRGRERQFRDELLALARVQPGESVLDVGCGTGSLAIAAKRHVSSTGTVHGIDASPAMIKRAMRKAHRRGIAVEFQQALAEALPFPDAQFDLVLSTVMLHHLPRLARRQCAGEIRRVLKPGGRVLVVDFAAPSRRRRGLIAHFHRHGYTKLEDIIALLTAAGLEMIHSGPVGMHDLQFVLAACRPIAAQP